MKLKAFKVAPITCGILIGFQSMCYAADDTLLLKKTPDLEGPVVEHTPVEGSIKAGEPITISAKVTDNVGIQQVIINYRASDSGEYRQLTMKKLSGDLYNGTIQSSQISGSTLEYYIEATDVTGNTVLRGLNFSPLKIAIKPSAEASKTSSLTPRGAIGEPVTAPPTTTPEAKEKKSTNWIWWAAGALAAGAATAYALRGGSGGGEDPETGTIVISSPQPN